MGTNKRLIPGIIFLVIGLAGTCWLLSGCGTSNKEIKPQCYRERIIICIENVGYAGHGNYISEGIGTMTVEAWHEDGGIVWDDNVAGHELRHHMADHGFKRIK